MTAKEIKEYLDCHMEKLHKVVHAWMWNCARAPYVSDLYFYPDGTFYIFVNPGGTSWLQGEGTCIASHDGEHCEIERGRFREFCNDQTDYIIESIFETLNEWEESEKINQELDEMEV